MPTVAEETVDGFAHCVMPRCSGSTQEPVKVLRRETAHTYRERGGDGPGIESSFVSLVFADEEETPCPHCGRPRDLSLEPRKQYAPLSGHDPMGLLASPKFDPKVQQELRQELQEKGIDPDKQALEQQNKELMERLAKLEAAQEKADEVG